VEESHIAYPPWSGAGEGQSGRRDCVSRVARHLLPTNFANGVCVAERSGCCPIPRAGPRSSVANGPTVGRELPPGCW